MSEFALSEWDMISPSVCQGYHSLLQEGQRFVDVHGFHLGITYRQSLPQSLRPGQVHKVQLGGDVLRVGLDARV